MRSNHDERITTLHATTTRQLNATHVTLTSLQLTADLSDLAIIHGESTSENSRTFDEVAVKILLAKFVAPFLGNPIGAVALHFGAFR